MKRLIEKENELNKWGKEVPIFQMKIISLEKENNVLSKEANSKHQLKIVSEKLEMAKGQINDLKKKVKLVEQRVEECKSKCKNKRRERGKQSHEKDRVLDAQIASIMLRSMIRI